MKDFATEQEHFWAGEFGTDYIGRNDSEDYLAANLNFFGEVLGKTKGVESLIELGPNIGMNLKAVQLLFPKAKLAGVEINQDATEILKAEFPQGDFFNESIFDFEPQTKYDLCLIKGVLIHLNPDMLGQAYEKLYKSSQKYVLIAEYFNRTPVTVEYRGHADKLFKRDFAGEFLDQYEDFSLRDYGFCYHRDPNFYQDDVSWFLLERD